MKLEHIEEIPESKEEEEKEETVTIRIIKDFADMNLMPQVLKCIKEEFGFHSPNKIQQFLIPALLT